MTSLFLTTASSDNSVVPPGLESLGPLFPALKPSTPSRQNRACWGPRRWAKFVRPSGAFGRLHKRPADQHHGYQQHDPGCECVPDPPPHHAKTGRAGDPGAGLSSFAPPGLSGGYTNARLISTMATNSTTPVANVYQINFFSIGSSGSYSRSIFCSSSNKRGSVISSPLHDWRQHPVEEQPRDEQPNPDDVSEQTKHVDRRQLGNALLPELAEVGQRSNGKERHHKKDGAENVSLAHGCLDLRHQGRHRRAEGENDPECNHVAQDELRETLPDFARPNFLTRARFDLGRPYPSQNKGPDANENVDEDFDRGADAHDPSGLVSDAGNS